MPLNISDHRLIAFAFDVHHDDLREKRFVLQSLAKRVGIQQQRGGFTFAAIDDARHLVGFTQAAARSFPYVLAQLCADLNLFGHVLSLQSDANCGIVFS